MDRLDDLVTRVLAPNPGLMTLEGTNTYLVGAPGSGEAVVVDPGPDAEEHRVAVEAAAAARDSRIAAVVVTHHHRDHAQAAGWAGRWGVALHAFSPEMVRGAAPDADPVALRDGDVLAIAGVRLQAVHTPGHSSDHLCLRVVETDVVLTGDHVLGRGTSVVVYPDGDMAEYVASLERLAASPATALYPGHGPALDRPARTLAEYLAHRAERERQVLAALAAGDRDPMAVVRRVYADVDPALHVAASRSVQAHLEKLVREGSVVRDGAPDDEGTAYRVR